eukprot:gene10268-12146_t
MEKSDQAFRENSASNGGTTSFGYKEVKVEEKETLVGEVFKRVAGSYDIMNDVMSGGLHRLWKDRLIEVLRPAPGSLHLDVAGGTGDVAFRVLESMRLQEKSCLNVSGKGSVIVFDINAAMLDEGRKRASARGVAQDSMQWIEGNAERLPFDDNSIDSYTICEPPSASGQPIAQTVKARIAPAAYMFVLNEKIRQANAHGEKILPRTAFGLRNCTHIDVVLRDAYRVLKPGGRFLCMEFSHVHDPFLQQLYDIHSFHIIPAMGQAIAGDRESYQYLVESIRKFPTQEKLSQMMASAGMRNVSYENLVGGVVAIHSGFKL